MNTIEEKNLDIAFSKMDNIISKINELKTELFDINLKKRRARKIPETLSDDKIMEIFIKLIAFSQNANSEVVERTIIKPEFNIAFSNYNVNVIAEMNPCDIVENHWDNIKGIRQQTKLFHIVMLARKIKKLNGISRIFFSSNIPKEIRNEDDIEQFWKGFKELQKILKAEKVPFFQSTTTLLHFLLDMGYDCVKPDLVVMKVAKKIGLVDKETGEKNLVKAVKLIQYYCISDEYRNKYKPSEIDLYFLVDEKQKAIEGFVNSEYYNERN